MYFWNAWYEIYKRFKFPSIFQTLRGKDCAWLLPRERRTCGTTMKNEIPRYASAIRALRNNCYNAADNNNNDDGSRF